MKLILLLLSGGILLVAKGQAPTLAIVGEEKRPGYYWDKEGVKHKGVLKPKFSTVYGKGTTVKFYQNGKKVGHLGTDEMASFIYDRDSFALIQKMQLNIETIYDTDFAKVVESGTLNLYIHWHKERHYGGTNTPLKTVIKPAYLIKEEGSSTFKVISHRGNFEAYFLPLIKDDEKLTKYILAMSKSEWLANLPRYISEYNSRH